MPARLLCVVSYFVINDQGSTDRSLCLCGPNRKNKNRLSNSLNTASLKVQHGKALAGKMLFVVPMHYLVQDDTCNPLPGFVPTYKTVGYEQSAGCRLYPEVRTDVSLARAWLACDRHVVPLSRYGVMCGISCSPMCLDWVFPVPRVRLCVDASCVSVCMSPVRLTFQAILTL